MLKQPVTSLLLIITFAIACAVPNANASQALTLPNGQAAIQEKISDNARLYGKWTGKSKRLDRISKKISRRVENATKAGGQVDFTDPVYKWLWFGIFGLLIALLLGIISVGLGGVVAFAAVVCLVIFLLKLNSAI